MLNPDADIYNGTGIGNYGAVEATDDPWHGRPASAVMVLPPLTALWFEPASLPPKRTNGRESASRTRHFVDLGD